MPERLQWSPVLETGNTWPLLSRPGRMCMLQWSPVLETGNTQGASDALYGVI